MKKIKLTHVHLTFLFCLTFFISSCEKEEIPTFEDINSIDHIDTSNFKTAKSGCADNLVISDDGCKFISGEGRDLPNQFIMVDMLNDCYTETLPSNCSWSRGNATYTKTIDIDLDYCCNTASVHNARLNMWKAKAEDEKINSSYLITGYERISGNMVTTYGPYRMKLKVTYRKKICRISKPMPVLRF